MKRCSFAMEMPLDIHKYQHSQDSHFDKNDRCTDRQKKMTQQSFVYDFKRGSQIQSMRNTLYFFL